MSENVEKKRENGYYWVRDHTGLVGGLFIVQVADGMILRMGYDPIVEETLESFESDFEFIAGPLTLPETP